MTVTDDVPVVFTVEEVAERLRCSVPTVRHLLATGQLKGNNVGTAGRSHWRVSSAQLSDYLEAQA